MSSTFGSTATVTYMGLASPMTATATAPLVDITPPIDLTYIRPYVDVRCPNCGKLICKWEFAGIANLEVKCARCGSINVIRLSTG